MKENEEKEIEKKMETEDEIKSSSPSSSNINNFFYLVYTLFSALAFALANVFMKKASIFNGIEQSFVKFSLQFLTIPLLTLCLGKSLIGPKESRVVLFTRSICGVIQFITYYYALSFLLPSEAIALHRLSIIFVTILSRFIFTEKLNFIHILAILLTIGGKLTVAYFKKKFSIKFYTEYIRNSKFLGIRGSCAF